MDIILVNTSVIDLVYFLTGMIHQEKVFVDLFVQTNQLETHVTTREGVVVNKEKDVNIYSVITGKHTLEKKNYSFNKEDKVHYVIVIINGKVIVVD